MVSALKRRILTALRQRLTPRLEERCAGLPFPTELSESEQAAFMAGFKAGFWQGSSDALTIGMDVLKKAAEEQTVSSATDEEAPTYAEA